jgi:hypothetical protein
MSLQSVVEPVVGRPGLKPPYTWFCDGAPFHSFGEMRKDKRKNEGRRGRIRGKNPLMAKVGFTPSCSSLIFQMDPQWIVAGVMLRCRAGTIPKES